MVRVKLSFVSVMDSTTSVYVKIYGFNSKLKEWKYVNILTEQPNNWSYLAIVIS